MEFYRQALEVDPGNINCNIKLGQILEDQREFDDAIQCYKKALKCDRTCFMALMRLGLVQIRNNMREKGIKQLQMAYDQDSTNLELKVKLAEIYVKDDDSRVDEAEKLLKEAIEVDYNQSDAHAVLGKVHEKKGRIDEAIEEFKIALRFPH